MSAANPPPSARSDLLEAGRGGRVSARARLAVLVVVVIVAVSALVVDLRLRRAEERALSACAEEAAAATQQATGTVRAMASYVRPTAFVAEPALRTSLYALVAQEAVGASAVLEPAREACAGIRVLWTHQVLRARREACVAHLANVAAYVDAVAADGRTAFVTSPERSPRC